MTRRPSRFQIAGKQSVFDILEDAPEPVRTAFYELITDLETKPYPDQNPQNVAEKRGTDRMHHYVAWNDLVRVEYLVMQDMPVISLVGVHWRGGGGPGDGGGEPGPDFAWAA